MKIVGIIPVRYDSTRFPGKPLAKISGKPMIWWVWKGAKSSKKLEKVIIATDDKRIYQTVKNFGGEVVMTGKFESGSDRVAYIARNLSADIFVNIQGDEPLIRGDVIDKAVMPLISDKSIDVATIVTKIKSTDEAESMDTVKVALDKDSFALYFSRSPIPFGAKEYFKHIGLYVFRKNFLLKFSKMKKTLLEKTEKLEQLRILENGYKVKVSVVDYDGITVERPSDLKKVRKHLTKFPKRRHI